MMKRYISTLAVAATALSLTGFTLAASAHGMNVTKGATGEQVKVCVQQRKDANVGEHPTRQQRLAIRMQYRTCIRNAVMLNHGHASSHSKSSHSTSSRSSKSSKPMTAKVEIEDFAFSPQVLTVKQGTTVRWKNEDNTPHTVTGSGGLDSGTLDYDESYSHTFTGTGTFNYHCDFHSNMTGAVIVTE